MPRNGSGVASQPTSTAAVSGDTISSTKFNSIMADIYSLFNTAWPLSLSQNLAALGGQPLNANLTSISSLGTAADKIAYTTGTGTWAQTAFPAWARAFNGSVDLPAARTYFYDDSINSISTQAIVAGDTLYATGPNTFVRLAKGTAYQTLRMKSDATVPEWGGGAIGEGQSWQDLTGSRAMGTIYQNTTGRAIHVNVFASGNDSALDSVFVLEIDDVTPPVVVAIQGKTTDFDAQIGPLSAIIPANHYYRFRKLSGANSVFALQRWSELR